MIGPAYVFGPWLLGGASDRAAAWREAPCAGDEAVIWLESDGSYAGTFGGTVNIFELTGAKTREDACAMLDAQIVAAGHYLGDRVTLVQEKPDLSVLEALPSCEDCPIGGRAGLGPACPRAPLCDQECAEQDAAYSAR